MIVLDLLCEREHRFEAWFASSDVFEAQARDGLVSCPHCGSSRVHRLPSAPYVQTSAHSAPVETDPDLAARLRQALRAAASQSEDVGARFPDEVRRIHYGDAEERAIRGQAKADEVIELLEEGIPVLPLPPDKDDLH